MIVTTSGIVLKSFKYGESSKIITIYTKDYGKISLMAKGSRKSKNKFGSTLDLLKIIKVSFYYKPNLEIYTLSNSEYIATLNSLQSSFEHLTAALIIAESLLKTQNIQYANRDLYDLTVHILLILDKKIDNPISYTIYYLINLTREMGFALEFGAYPQRKENDNNDVIFSLSKGQIVLENGKDIYHIKKEIATLLSELSKGNLIDLSNICIAKQNIILIFDFLKVYINYHLDKKIDFKTLKLFESFL